MGISWDSWDKGACYCYTEPVTKADLINALECVGDDAVIYIETGDAYSPYRIKCVEKVPDEGDGSPAFINLLPASKAWDGLAE